MPESNLTKKALAQALKDLMKKESFQKISVGDICAACGMNRKSFYYHFKDKYDLVNWIFTTEYLDKVDIGEYTAPWDLFVDMSLYIYGEREFYRPAFAIEGQNSFTAYFSEIIAETVRGMMAREAPRYADWPFWDAAISLIADAAFPAFFAWLTMQDDLDVEGFLETSREGIFDMVVDMFRSDRPHPRPDRET